MRRKLEDCRRRAVPVDYVTVVPDGEPTLDVNLGRLITELRALGVPVAVISNGSLLDRADVRAELALADVVSVKVDAVDEQVWRWIDRPHGALRLGPILAGLRRLSVDVAGRLITETMLLDGVNDDGPQLEALADFLGEVAPRAAYLAIPIRPPAEPWARPSTPEGVVRAFEAVSRRVDRIELLVGLPPAPVATSGSLEQDLLAITAVHPLDEAAVVELGGGPGALEIAARLVSEGRLAAAPYRGRTFFLHAATRPRARVSRSPARARPQPNS